MSKNIGGSITQFEYDGFNPVQELDGANPASVTANLLTGLNIDEYFARTDSNGAMNFISDALGSTLALTDSSGTINTSYTYEPFGNTTVGGSNPNPYQFTGRENDGTGLYFNRARYYSPTYQRFIAQDPLDFGGGDLNLYAFVRNDPANLTDKMGLCPPGTHPNCPGGSFGSCVAFGISAVSLTEDIALLVCGGSGPAAPLCLAAVEAAYLGPQIGVFVVCRNLCS